jgi:hypothetical protein
LLLRSFGVTQSAGYKVIKNTARLISTSSFSQVNILNLHSFFITGLTDAKGSFVCIIRKIEKHRLGWRVEVVFQIALHKKDLELLKAIKTFFGCGKLE